MVLTACLPCSLRQDVFSKRTHNPVYPRKVATLRRYCVHSTLVPAVVPIFVFPHDWEIHMKELLLSNGRVLGGKRGKWGTRLAKIPHPVMCSLFFFQISRTNPSPNHFFLGGLIFWALWGYCSAVPFQLGVDSCMSHSPAPVTCVWRFTLHNISLASPPNAGSPV
jgi:hypothetical protein